MSETGEPRQLLTALFLQRFGARAAAELQTFLEQVQQVDLPFGDLTAQMRRQEHLGYPGFECGLPPRFYYFVPGTTYGGHKPAPADPLDLSFVGSVDGLGLNFGCPLRLRRALAALLSLPPEQQREEWIATVALNA